MVLGLWIDFFEGEGLVCSTKRDSTDPLDLYLGDDLADLLPTLDATEGMLHPDPVFGVKIGPGIPIATIADFDKMPPGGLHLLP